MLKNRFQNYYTFIYKIKKKPSENNKIVSQNVNFKPKSAKLYFYDIIF